MVTLSHRIVVSDPFFRVSRQVAWALQERGLNYEYFTSFDCPDRLAERLLEALPFAGSQLSGSLRRRSDASYPLLHVQEIPRPELLCRRISKANYIAPAIRPDHWIQNRFDEAVANRLRATDQLVYANESCGFQTFNRTRSRR